MRIVHSSGALTVGVIVPFVMVTPIGVLAAFTKIRVSASISPNCSIFPFLRVYVRVPNSPYTAGGSLGVQAHFRIRMGKAILRDSYSMSRPWIRIGRVAAVGPGQGLVREGTPGTGRDQRAIA